jgi:hypothetical protein
MACQRSALTLIFGTLLCLPGCILYADKDDEHEHTGDEGPWVSSDAGPGGKVCTGHQDCVSGTYCAPDSKTCEPAPRCPTGTCTGGWSCDTPRTTCVPPAGTTSASAGRCHDPVSCPQAAPACPAGTTPGIQDGCYTGFCIPTSACEPEPTCAELTTESACLAEADRCRSLYSGVNCSCGEGCSCTQNQTGCTCESFTWAGCLAAP